MLDQKTKNMKVIGMIFFFLGSITAISMAAKMPAAGSEYPTTTGIFAVALAFGVLGNIIWHKTEKKSVLAELEMHKNDEAHNPVILLTKTIPEIEKLLAEYDSCKDIEACDKIDEIMDTYIHPFTEKGKTFMDILGQKNGSEVLLVIAYAERMLNRVWSATSDGYPQEAKNCLEDSLKNYQEALNKTNTYIA
jgi:hypothetical protein